MADRPAGGRALRPGAGRPALSGPLPPERPVIAVVGPTASGKSAVAQAVAQALDGEVVSADSMQVYRGMDIGTGKVPVAERVVPHHGLDLVDPGQAYSAALFQAYAREAFAAIEGRGRRAILAGGTGFYVRAALDDYRFPVGEQVGNPVRERWQRYAEEQGAQALWERLREQDPASAEAIHPNNVVRVVRAFELLAEGESYARQKASLAAVAPWAAAQWVGLAVEPGRLAARIEARVDAMFDQGLVEEVEGLLARGYGQALTAASAIGYKEVVAALRDECSLDEAREAIKAATRRYAKRQRTWFRSDGRIAWFDTDEADDPRGFEELAQRIVEHLEGSGLATAGVGC